MAKGIAGTVSSLLTRMRKKLRSEQDEEIYKREEKDSRLASCFSLRRNRSSDEDWFEVPRSPLNSSLPSRWNEKALMSPYVGGKKRDGLWVEEKKKKGRRDGDGLWTRTILLGEKCRPLDFDGVIHYDHQGRRVLELPRSPMRSPLPSFFVKADVSSGEGGN